MPHQCTLWHCCWYCCRCIQSYYSWAGRLAVLSWKDSLKTQHHQNDRSRTTRPHQHHFQINGTNRYSRTCQFLSITDATVTWSCPPRVFYCCSESTLQKWISQGEKHTRPNSAEHAVTAVSSSIYNFNLAAVCFLLLLAASVACLHLGRLRSRCWWLGVIPSVGVLTATLSCMILQIR